MLKKLFPLLFFLLFFVVKAQNEFITIWQPGIATTPVQTVDAPYQANANQIWFPGIGQNYTIEWEEVGYPANNGIMTNVTSTSQVLIDFGAPRENGSGLYRVKVSNGNGVFQQIKMASYQLGVSSLIPTNIVLKGSADKLLTIEQWGNINWTSMAGAFANCQRVLLTATDSPNLSNVTDASVMFFNAFSFSGALSMQNWDVSNIQNFRHMFDIRHQTTIYALGETFNSPIGNWDVSVGIDFGFMFAGRQYFNQNLNSWDVSNATSTKWMFMACSVFNQPLNNWNMSNVEDIQFMFHSCTVFNQPLDNWDVSNVTKMNHTFGYTAAFNQSLSNWDMSNVQDIGFMFGNATAFNQSLGMWNLSSLIMAPSALQSSGLDCQNYSATLAGWADNPNTPNNILLSNVSPLQYASNVVTKRDYLLNTKNWIFSGDTLGTCMLSTSEIQKTEKGSIYPNPVSDVIYIENISNAVSYKILDMAGGIIRHNKIKSKIIEVHHLPKGNYLLEISTEEDAQVFKFIKE